MKKSPFELINKINEGKYSKVDSNFNKFLVNRFYSYFIDTILIANEANKFTKVSDQMVYDYYLALIKPKKRFAKWYKSPDHEKINMVAEYFNLNMKKTREIMDILTIENLEEIRSWYTSRENI